LNILNLRKAREGWDTRGSPLLEKREKWGTRHPAVFNLIITTKL
jgi:hypothetical protein